MHVNQIKKVRLNPNISLIIFINTDDEIDKTFAKLDTLIKNNIQLYEIYTIADLSNFHIDMYRPSPFIQLLSIKIHYKRHAQNILMRMAKYLPAVSILTPRETCKSFKLTIDLLHTIKIKIILPMHIFINKSKINVLFTKLDMLQENNLSIYDIYTINDENYYNGGIKAHHTKKHAMIKYISL